MYFDIESFSDILIVLKNNRKSCVRVYTINNNNNNNCLKSNIQCIEIRVQWTVHLGSSHMHVHAVTRVHAVTPNYFVCGKLYLPEHV